MVRFGTMMMEQSSFLMLKEKGQCQTYFWLICIILSANIINLMLQWINNNLNKVSITNIISQTEPPQLTLQQNLAGKILQLQFQCQGACGTKQLIVELIKLYTQAILFYQDQDDPRYSIFRKRMEYFLKKQNIDEILRGKSGELVSKKDIVNKHFTQARTKSKSQVTKLLQKSQKLVTKKQLIVQKTLQQQTKRLKDRIERRKAMSNRSSNTQDDQQNVQTFQKMNCNMLLDSILQRQSDKKMKKVFI